ncbi:MAG: folylpolyglutamate synthase/dihydrofolate synthase family protein [Candidatus Diapherotrites archaeon]
MNQTPHPYLEQIEGRGIKLGLERMEKYLEFLGNPHCNYNSVLVAGTNGKGSVTNMVASILHEANFRTGAYTSPHVIDYNERFKINNKKISTKEMNSLISAMAKFDSQVKPTYFEFATAFALNYFAKKKVDYAVLEVGMGGRLDATNITNPQISVITNISFEHQNYLGNTILKIAGEKAGIIKENGILITTEKNKSVLKLFRKICKQKNSKFIHITKPYKGKISLIGDYQKINAALAERVAEELNIKSSAIRKGIAKAENVGRFQIIQKNPTLLTDCSHNPAGMKAFTHSLKIQFPKRKFTFVIGFSDGKNYKEMLKMIVPNAEKIVVTSAEWRGMATSEIISAIRKQNKKIELVEISVVKEAVKFAVKDSHKKDYIVVCGSIFVVGEYLN